MLHFEHVFHTIVLNICSERMFSDDMSSGRKQGGCRLALLEAAGPVFADKGYRQATVREIARRAGAGLGAVNYHFRDKEGLYEEVLAFAHDVTIAQYRAAIAAETDPARQLFRFVRAALSHRLAADDGNAWAGRVLVTALVNMDEHNRDMLFRRVIAPRQALLARVVRALMGPAPSEETIKSHTLGIMGQYILYYASRPVVEMSYGRALTAADLDWISRHITRVSVAGMRAAQADQDTSGEDH